MTVLYEEQNVHEA